MHAPTGPLITSGSCPFLDAQYQSWRDFPLLVIFMQVMWTADFIAGHSNLPFWTRCLNIGWRFRYHMPSQACQPN